MSRLLKQLVGAVLVIFLLTPDALGKGNFFSFKVKVKVISFDARSITVKYGKRILRVPRTAAITPRERSPFTGEVIEIDMLRVTPNTEIKIVDTEK